MEFRFLGTCLFSEIDAGKTSSTCFPQITLSEPGGRLMKKEEPPVPDPASLTPESKLACCECGNATFPISHADHPDLFDEAIVEAVILTTGFGSVEEAIARTVDRLCAVKGGFLARARPLASVLHTLGVPAFASTETRPWDDSSASPFDGAVVLAADQKPRATKPSESDSPVERFNRRYGIRSGQTSERPARVVASTKSVPATIGDRIQLDPKQFPVVPDDVLAERAKKLEAQKARKQRPRLLKKALAGVRQTFDNAACGDLVIELFDEFDAPREELVDRVQGIPEDTSNVEVLLHLIDHDILLDAWIASKGEEFAFALAEPEPRFELVSASKDNEMIDPDQIQPLERLPDSMVMMVGIDPDPSPAPVESPEPVRPTIAPPEA